MNQFWKRKKYQKSLYIDLDRKGNLVSMTIEHAKEKANISEVSDCKWNKSLHNSSFQRVAR